MVRARVDSTRYMLAPGASVRVRVPVGPLRRAVVIPINALRKGPGGDQVFVIAPDQEQKALPPWASAVLLVAVPVGITFVLRAAHALSERREIEVFAALAWDRERAQAFAERARRIEEISWAQEQERDLERQRDTARARLREISARATEATRLVAMLNHMQDIIGDWHDWLQLAERAEKMFGGVQEVEFVPKIAVAFGRGQKQDCHLRQRKQDNPGHTGSKRE